MSRCVLKLKFAASIFSFSVMFIDQRERFVNCVSLCLLIANVIQMFNVNFSTPNFLPTSLIRTWIPEKERMSPSD